MAGNSYLESIAKARQFVQDHLKDWEDIDRKVLDIVGNAQKITNIPVESGSLKELNNRIEEQVQLRQQLNAVVKEQETKIKALQSQLSKLSSTEKGRSKTLSAEERQLNALRKSEERLIDVKSEVWKQVEANRQQANQEAQGIRNRLSDYGQYSQQLIQMSREYKDLAIQKMRLNNLSAKEEKRMRGLGKTIGELRGQLVQVDHSVGQFGRSVGSYGKQFDSLGFSMAQITREFPAFAYGAQIGFAALSNNIPILFDEIEKTRREVRRLKEAGEETASVMSRIGSSIFGLQTLLSVGVTLLTLYGAQWVEAAGGLFDFRDEAEKAKDALEDLDKSLEEYVDSLRDIEKVRLKGVKDAQEELITLKLLNDEVHDLTKSEEDRMKALDTLRDKYPKHLENMTDEEILVNGIGEAYAELSTQILEAARSRAAFDKILENTSRKIEVEGLLATKRVELAAATEQHSKAEKALNDAYEQGLSTEIINNRAAALGRIAPLFNELTREVSELETEERKLIDMNEELTDSVTHLGETVEKNAPKPPKEEREKIKTISELNDTYKYSVEYYEQLIASFEAGRKKVARSSEEWANFTKQIEDAQNAIKVIQDIQQFARDEMELSPDELEAFTLEVTTRLSTDGIERGMKKLQEITGSSLADLYREMHMWYGKDFDSFMEFWDAKISKEEEAAEKMKELRREIAEAAIEFGDALFEAEIERIDQKIERNKDYYAQLLAGEELTQERREALEAQRDLKERKLMKEKRKRENEQFLFEQAIALAKVAMHTAVGIAEALPNLALATLVGILGGIQAATIIALSVPKFREGTQNAPEGLALVDEVNPEVHTDKHGRVKSYGSDKGPNLRFLEQGDKIYKSREKYFKTVGTTEIENTIWDLNMQHQGRPIPESAVDNALLREISAMRSDSNRMWKAVKKLASRPINNNLKVEFPDNRMY